MFSSQDLFIVVEISMFESKAKQTPMGLLGSVFQRIGKSSQQFFQRVAQTLWKFSISTEKSNICKAQRFNFFKLREYGITMLNRANKTLDDEEREELLDRAIQCFKAVLKDQPANLHLNERLLECYILRVTAAMRTEKDGDGNLWLLTQSISTFIENFMRQNPAYAKVHIYLVGNCFWRLE